MKLYERMIRLIDYSDKMSKLCIELNKQINEETLQDYDAKIKMNTLFREYNNSIVESLVGFDRSDIFDEDIQRQVNHLLEDASQELFYNVCILCEIINHIRFIKFGKSDAVYFSKKIYDISERIHTSAIAIKFSDYCYVERGLLKKEDIYKDLKKDNNVNIIESIKLYKRNIKEG